MSEYLNKKYHLEMEVISPLHIGAGQEKDWMKGADYVIENKKLYKLNHKKVLSKISSDEFSTILLTKDDNALKRKIADKIEEVADEIFDAPISSENDIKSFIKNGLSNKPIVPGSSVKGAIRSIILNYLLNNSKPFQLNEREIFGDSNKGDEFMRFVKISDVQFSRTDLINTKIFNLYGLAPDLNGGWKHSGGRNGKTTNRFDPTGFNTIYEIIRPEEKGTFSLSLSDKGFDNLKNDSNIRITEEKKKSDIVHLDIKKHLFKIINEQTSNYIIKQIAFFKKYANNETDFIIDSLHRIKKQIPEDNSACVLQMSGGSGFHSITGDWQFDDFSIDAIDVNDRNRGKLRGKSSAKSRKIATDGHTFELMGFVKLSIISEEIIAQRANEHKAKLKEDQLAEELRMANEREEQDRVESVMLAKIASEKKAEEAIIEKERLEREELERLLQKKEDDLKNAREANLIKKESEIERIVTKGLDELSTLNDFDKGKKIIEQYFKALESDLITDEVQVRFLEIFIEHCIRKSNKRWKKAGKQDWVLVVKWIGKEMVQQWFDSMKP